MPIPAAHIQHRRREIDLFIEASFYRSHEGAEIRQVFEVEPQVVFVGHDIMLSLLLN
jgi:hypothetical protein